MGLWSFAVGRGEWQRSLELAERNLRLAQSIAAPAQLARSWRGLGHVQYFLGRFDEARENLERAIALTAIRSRGRTLSRTCRTSGSRRAVRWRGRWS